MADYFERQGQWRDWADTYQIALVAARRQGDRAGQARAYVGLGRACNRLGQFGETLAHLGQALRLFDELGDQAAQAQTHLFFGVTLERRGRLQEALSQAYLALPLARAAANRLAQANALNNIGWSHALLGDPHQALVHCEQALALEQNWPTAKVKPSA